MSEQTVWKAALEWGKPCEHQHRHARTAQMCAYRNTGFADGMVWRDGVLGYTFNLGEELANGDAPTAKDDPEREEFWESQASINGWGDPVWN